jgi:hypothetical protein
MKRNKLPEKKHVSLKQQAVKAPAAKQQESQRSIIERPDGFYWQAADSGEEYGPFTTRAEAQTDMLSGEELESSDTLQEAESEFGISEWIDPDTGDPAEDSVPRIEDH